MAMGTARVKINPERNSLIDMRPVKDRYADACAKVAVLLGSNRTDPTTLVELDINGIRLSRLAQLMLEERNGSL